MPDDLLGLDEDREAPVLEVDVAPPQAEELTGAQSDEAGDDNERSEPGRDRVGEAEHKFGVDHRPLLGMVGAAAPDATWIAPDQVVIDGGVEDRPQQPVALRRLVT